MGKLPVIGVGWATLACVATVGVCAQTQSLADVARQEKTRRAGITESSRVYTNDDLRGGRGLTTGRSVDTDVETDSERPADELDTPADERELEPVPDTSALDQAHWRDRITSAREGKQRAELMAAALQNRIDGLWANFTARDDPLQRDEIERDRLAALRELQRSEAEVERLDQEIRDIQEEARRGGVPPGWLR